MARHIFSKRWGMDKTQQVIDEVIIDMVGEWDKERTLEVLQPDWATNVEVVKTTILPPMENIDICKELDELADRPEKDVNDLLVQVNIPDEYTIAADCVEYDVKTNTTNHKVIIGKDIRVLDLSKESTYRSLVVPFRFNK